VVGGDAVLTTASLLGVGTIKAAVRHDKGMVRHSEYPNALGYTAGLGGSEASAHVPTAA